MTNEQIVREACRVIWSEGDTSRIGEFYAEDFQADYPRTNWGSGLEGIRLLVDEIQTSFPDYQEHIDELIDAGDLIIVRLTLRGTQTGPISSDLRTVRSRMCIRIGVLSSSSNMAGRSRRTCARMCARLESQRV